MRMIDADKLIRDILMEDATLDAEGLYVAYNYEISKGNVIDIINGQPTMNSLEQMLDYFEECHRAEPKDKDVTYICVYLTNLVDRMRKREKHLNDSERVSRADKDHPNKDTHPQR